MVFETNTKYVIINEWLEKYVVEFRILGDRNVIMNIHNAYFVLYWLRILYVLDCVRLYNSKRKRFEVLYGDYGLPYFTEGEPYEKS